MKPLDSGYCDVGADKGKATLTKAAKHIMDTIDTEGGRIRREGMGVALAGAPQEGEADFLMYCEWTWGKGRWECQSKSELLQVKLATILVRVGNF
ncbi:hypothetical protein [Chromobacterium sp. Beijing]|uniref:hypothetical protein n=1 Tax=Chromobacterium sp. Beijing TaxID=2735795 RepID=UPI001F1C3700|nr:hypothetical protein [Chromobacterium sp. Beijing]UJB31505.1 hypothetical protein HQN78_10795 [Chromobacterium sp. Beijing]